MNHIFAINPSIYYINKNYMILWKEGKKSKKYVFSEKNMHICINHIRETFNLDKNQIQKILIDFYYSKLSKTKLTEFDTEIISPITLSLFNQLCAKYSLSQKLGNKFFNYIEIIPEDLSRRNFLNKFIFENKSEIDLYDFLSDELEEIDKELFQDFSNKKKSQKKHKDLYYAIRNQSIESIFIIYKALINKISQLFKEQEERQLIHKILFKYDKNDQALEFKTQEEKREIFYQQVKFYLIELSQKKLEKLIDCIFNKEITAKEFKKCIWE